MPSSVNIADPKKITAWLLEQAEGDAVVGGWLEVALLPSLKKRQESAVELERLPKNAPGWLRGKWGSGGPFHACKADAELVRKVRLRP